MPGILDDPSATIMRNPVLQVDPAAGGFHASGAGILGSRLPSSAADFKALNANRAPGEAQWLRPSADGVKEGQNFAGFVYHTSHQEAAPSIQTGGLGRGTFFSQDFAEPPPGMEGVFPTYRVRKEGHPMVVDDSAGATDFRAFGQIAPKDIEVYAGNGNWQALGGAAP